MTFQAKMNRRFTIQIAAIMFAKPRVTYIVQIASSPLILLEQT
jgi:hypothetical protein